MDALTGVLDTGELWRLTMEHSPIGMALVSPDGEILAANAALGEMLGYDPVELAHRTVADLTHPDDLATDVDLMRMAMAGSTTSYRVPKRCFRSDGTLLQGELSALLLRDTHGAPLQFIMQIIDRTEVHAFAERLDAAEETTHDLLSKGQAILDSVSVGLLLVDADGTYSAWNRRQQELLDIAFPEGHGGRAGQSGFVYDAEQQEALSFDQFPCARATEGEGEEFDDLLIWIGPEPATRRALSVSARTVRDRTGGLTGAVLAYHDVTQLIQAVSVKDEFVSTVSHELRTPLTSALAYLELLEDSVDAVPEALQQVSAARRNMLRLSHLVADLIFSTRASSGSTVIDPHHVDLVRVVREAVDAAAVVAEGAGVRLSSTHPDRLEVVADGIRLRQALDNLVANAILYSRPDGHVDVTVANTDPGVVITVVDDGEGIDADDVDQVFGRFFPRPERPPAPGRGHRSGPDHRPHHRRGTRGRRVGGEHRRSGHHRADGAAALVVWTGPGSSFPHLDVHLTRFSRGWRSRPARIHSSARSGVRSSLRAGIAQTDLQACGRPYGRATDRRKRMLRSPVNARTPRTNAGGPGAYRVGSGACLARWGPSREAVVNVCHQEHLPTALA